MMDFCGGIEGQDWDVAVDEAAGDLIVAMNGGTFLRLHLPPAAWAELQRAARGAIEAAGSMAWNREDGTA